MANEWYYRQQGKEEGPFSPVELRSKASAGEITTDASIRRGADGTWVHATKVKGLFAVPTVAARLGSSSPQVPPQDVATCWYCGNLRRTTDAHCGSCGASWSSEQPPVVADQHRATQGFDARAMIGLIFLIMAGLAMATHGLFNGKSFALGAGGLVLAATSLAALLLPAWVRAQQNKPGRQKVPTKAGSASVPHAASQLNAPDTAVSTTEGLRRGVGYVGYVALWVTFAVAGAGVVLVVVVLAAVVALFAICSDMVSPR